MCNEAFDRKLHDERIRFDMLPFLFSYFRPFQALFAGRDDAAAQLFIFARPRKIALRQLPWAGDASITYEATPARVRAFTHDECAACIIFITPCRNIRAFAY